MTSFNWIIIFSLILRISLKLLTDKKKMFLEGPTDIFNFEQSAELLRELNTLSTGESTSELIQECSSTHMSETDLSIYLNESSRLEHSSANPCLSQVNNWKNGPVQLNTDNIQQSLFDMTLCPTNMGYSTKMVQQTRKSILHEQKRKERKSKKLLKQQMLSKTQKQPPDQMCQVNYYNK